MTKAEKLEQADAIKRLREWLKPGDTVYTVLRHVSYSGMSREISLHMVEPDGRISWLSGLAARAMGDKLGKRDGIKVGGCGMDMGFHLVYNLGRTLFPEGFGTSGSLPLGHEIRPKSKEAAAKAVAKGATFRGRNEDATGWDSDGGYALVQRWI